MKILRWFFVQVRSRDAWFAPGFAARWQSVKAYSRRDAIKMAFTVNRNMAITTGAVIPAHPMPGKVPRGCLPRFHNSP